MGAMPLTLQERPMGAMLLAQAADQREAWGHCWAACSTRNRVTAWASSMYTTT